MANVVNWGKDLEEGKKYTLGNLKKEKGVFVKKVKGILFFDVDRPTKLEIDTREGFEAGYCYEEGIGLAGFPDTGTCDYELITNFKKKHRMKKVRLRKEDQKRVADSDHIGIKWKAGEKGILIEGKEGYLVLNNDDSSIKMSFVHASKSEYLKIDSVKRDSKKVFKFESYKALLKWFAK